ncbi:DUF7620 family protein [Streptomyces sediminimaris]|uniref:DUF7620 family protein n=1 Tax=Streptomyces sediminimaris TaxID=3383721 RepID=UPI003D9C3DAA
MPTWIRRPLRRHRDENEDRPMTEGQREANAALGRAKDARARVRAQAGQVRAEAEGWRARRERNHFAELITETVLGGGRK